MVVDPISNLRCGRNERAVKPTLMRLIDFLKQRQITALFTSLTTGGDGERWQNPKVGVSSLMDTWLLLRNSRSTASATATFYVLKSRGMAHSNQVREFVLSDRGIDWSTSISARRVHVLARPGTNARAHVRAA